MTKETNNFTGHNLQEGLPTTGRHYLSPIYTPDMKYIMFFNHNPDKAGDIRYQIHEFKTFNSRYVPRKWLVILRNPYIIVYHLRELWWRLRYKHFHREEHR